MKQEATVNNRTIIDQLTELSVDVNGLIVPGGLIGSVLARHAQPLFIALDDEYKVALFGSATAVRYKGREILLTSRHQLDEVQRNGFDESQVAMLTDTGSHTITSGGRRSYNSSLYADAADTDAYDIVAFNFSEPCKDRPELKKRFFDLQSAPPDTLNVLVLAMLLTGYPSAAQKYEMYEHNHLGLARRQVVCLPDSQPSDEALLAVKVQQPLEQHPAGMSGGSAFVIHLENGGPKAYFAGIIVRGGREVFHVLKLGFVIGFLNRAFA